MSHTKRLSLFCCIAATVACSPPENDRSSDGGGEEVHTNEDAPAADLGDSGADGADSSGPASLVDQSAWETAAATDDPFDDRPAMVDCEPDVAWGLEELDGTATLAVDTGACNYLTATQPLAVDLQAGGDVTIQLWHFELQGDGEAHIALQIGDEAVWERRVPIPSDSELIDETFATAEAHTAGEPVYFHLHNHGINSYNLTALTTP